MASLLEQLEAGDAADDEERAADARFARMLQRMKEGGDGAEREASLQSEIDALSAAEASVSPSLDHGRDLVLTEPQSIIFGKLKNTKKQTVKAEYYEFESL